MARDVRFAVLGSGWYAAADHGVLGSCGCSGVGIGGSRRQAIGELSGCHVGVFSTDSAVWLSGFEMCVSATVMRFLIFEVSGILSVLW